MPIEIEHYPEDIDRIIEIFRYRNYRIDRKTADEAWQKYSDSMDVGWIILPENDEDIFNIIWSYTDDKP